MKAMILAAGRGERMRPLTDSCPKPLLMVGGVPLIVHHLRRLCAAGIHDVVINHAWLGQQIEAVLGDGRDYGVHISYSDEGGTGLETAGGIATALPLLGDEPFLVINGDVLTNIDFQATGALAATLLQQHYSAYLWLVDNPPHHPHGDFALMANGEIHEQDNAGEQLTFSGVGIYHSELFRHMPAHHSAKLAPLLRQAINAGRVCGTKHCGIWLDVGTVERLAEANRLMANHHALD